MKPHHVGLVGDVGGTNARFALVDAEGRVRNLHVFEAKKYASLTDVIAEYLERTVGRKRPARAVVAVAGAAGRRRSPAGRCSASSAR